MRHIGFWVALALAAACGGDDDGGGGGRADARPTGDGGGGGDAGDQPDGGGGDGPALIWAHGDFAVDNRPQLGAFAPDAALPVTPSLILPGGDTAEVWEFGSADYGPFDISPDGTRVAFSADLEVAGQFDLWTVPVEGGEPTRVVAVGADRAVQRVRFSPDGARIAFAADIDSAGQLSAYVVAADAVDATPALLSPPFAAANTQLDVDDIVWSTDSQSVVVTGDFTTQDVHEMWIADADAADPTPVPLVDSDRIDATGVGVKGAIFPLLVEGGRVLFKSRLDADNRYKLTLIDTDGQNEGILPNSEIARIDDSIADVGTMALSPDRSQIAFAADQVATIYDVWVMPADGSMSPTQLTEELAEEDTNPLHAQPLKWSPDGQSIAFIADFASDGKDEPYVLPVAGGGQVRIATIGESPADGTDAKALTWSPAGDALFMIADHLGDNDFELFRLDPDQADQDPALAIDAPEDGDLSGVRASD